MKGVKRDGTFIFEEVVQETGFSRAGISDHDELDQIVVFVFIHFARFDFFVILGRKSNSFSNKQGEKINRFWF